MVIITWAILMPVGKLMTPLGCTWCNFDKIRPTSAVKVANTRTLNKKKNDQALEFNVI
jgi:hypothetical protein